MKRNPAAARLAEALAWLCSLSVLLPVYLIVINALKTAGEANTMSISLPRAFQWSNFAAAVERGKLVQSFFNSLLMASVSATISIVISAMAAYVLVRNRDRLNKWMYSYFFLGLVAPLNYVTTIKVLQLLGLQNTFAGIILVFAALGIPFAVFLISGFIGSIPAELDEAAIIDGCGLNRLFFLVVFPLLKPVTVTGFILNFLGAWNDFVTPLYLLNRSDKLGMVNAIYHFFGMHFNEWNMISMVIVLSILPVLTLYLFGQRYIISGMTSGSIKG
mgnify:CR=1 FL=1